MQTNANHQQILQLIDKELRLPSPPAIAVRILHTVQKDDSGLSELGDIISTDPALTAKMLSLANSGFFSSAGQITSIKRALAVLGTNVIRNIALSFIIANELANDSNSGFDMERYWQVSVTTAVAAEVLAKRLDQDSDDLFASALLQDIGVLVIALTKGEPYLKLLNNTLAFGFDLHSQEQISFGYDHQQVGYALLRKWQLPDEICAPLVFHHCPDKAPPELKKTTDLLHFAARISEVYNVSGMAEKARHLQQELAATFSFSSDQTATILDETACCSRKVLESFELEPTDMRPYSELLQEANEELARMNISNAQVILEMREAKEKAEKLTKELQDANERLRELVYRDGLTMLYNHRYFQESLANELARSTRYRSSVSLILFNIDHFKNINDNFGHFAGDQVLKNIAKAVSTAVRPSDIVARYGGEDFAVILPETNAAGAKVFSARLRRCVEGIATLVDGQMIYVSISAGTTTYSGHMGGTTKDHLIETAARGLHLAKQAGRNQVISLDLENADH